MKKTCDTLFNGHLRCKQYEKGYRFSVDAVLLAHFCQPAKKDRNVLDLCCGSGVVGLILAYRHPALDICGIELQPSLAALATENSRDNGLTDRFTILNCDAAHIAQCIEAEYFDIVYCNPPYRKEKSGRLNVSDEATIARHEVHGDVYDFVKAAAYSVKNRGKVVFVYPAVRAAVCITAMNNARLSVKKIQPVYSYPDDQSARLVLLEAVKNGGEQCEILPPLYIYTQKNGPYTPEMEAMYR